MADSDIFVRFGADVGPLKKGSQEASKSIGGVGSSAKNTAGKLAKMAAVAVAAGAALGVKLVKDSLQAIDAQAKLAKQLGTSSASLATLDRAAEMSGISMKSIESGAKNLEVVMGEAAHGTGTAVDTLRKLDLTARDLEGMTLDQKLLTVNKALNENIPATERASAAADLFGKKAGFAIAQLTPETINEARRQMEGFGLAISDVDAAKIEAANDAVSSIGRAVDGVGNQLTIALAPMLEHLALKFQEAAIEAGGFEEEAVAAVNGVIKAVGFVGNAFHGIDIIIDSSIVAFQALKAAALAVSLSIAEAVDAAVEGVVSNINGMIDSVNNIPGVDVSKLVVGQSELTASIKNAAIEANQEMIASVKDLHNKMMEPLPSEQLEAFVASINDPSILEAKQAQVDQLAMIEVAGLESSLEKQKSFAEKMKTIKQSWTTSETDAVANMFGNLSTLMESGNKRMFEIGKTAAKAQTVVSTISSAQKSYESLSGIPIVGPSLGAAAAAAAVVAGGVRLNAINSTSFGGGGSVNTSAAGGASSASTPSAAAPEQNKTVRIEGIDANQNFSGTQVQALAENLVELQNDGFQLVV